MSLLEITIMLIVVAFALIFIGVALLIVDGLKNSEKDSKVKGGGVIVIGPIPIVIGTSEKASKVLIILAIILTLVTLITFLITTGLIRIRGP
ncbi:MAG: DUF131 domain-containing protein [Ignisphaera sp.]